jgi:hypothetical protein
MMGDREERCRRHRSDHTSYVAPRCNNHGGITAGLRRHHKKVQ